MSQTTQLVETLKKTLKAHGKTYAQLAKDIRLSEASIKRLFSEKNFSLNRLEEICHSIDLELSDLVQLMNEEKSRLKQLTEEQEKEIVSDLSLLLVTVCVLNRWTMDDITQRYTITEHECIQYLARLDRLKLIELLPKNKIKLRVDSNFNWRTNGPVHDFFHTKVQSDFFSSRFNKDGELLLANNGMLSMASNAVMQKKMQRLLTEFNELNNDDAGLSMEEKHGTSIVLAMRQWEFGLFEHLRR